MANVKDLRPYKVIGPGEIIKDYLEFNRWTQEDLANIMNISAKHINSIISNKQAITLEIAFALSKVFGNSAQFWINLYTNYHIKTSLDSEKGKEIENKSMLYRYMPISEMQKRKWINKSKDASTLLNDIREFWNETNINSAFFEKRIETFAFRKSEAFHNFDINSALTWLQRAKNIAASIKVEKFDKKKLIVIANNINIYTTKKEGISEFIKILEDSGVKFINLKHLPHTYIDGATFYSQDNPVIVYTARYNRRDNFWFTIAHEIGHVILHLDKNSTGIIEGEKIDRNNQIEEEANDYAAKILKHKYIVEYFQDKLNYIKEKDIIDCAKKLNIHESIIIGALAFKEKTFYNRLHKYSNDVLSYIPHKYQFH